jgi:acetoacetyl-CoA synthetase
VYLGGTQGPSLGVAVEVYDSLQPNGPGKAVPHGTAGELVAPSSFPNVPVYLWGDRPGRPAAEGYDHVWAHGDFCVVHPSTGGLTILGRADGVLNPSGVRFGSAEIYGVIERWFADKVADSLCVGQRRPQDQDESVMLFLLMRHGQRFSEALVSQIQQAIARDLTKRHVPRYIFETPEIPVSVKSKDFSDKVSALTDGSLLHSRRLSISRK